MCVHIEFKFILGPVHEFEGWKMEGWGGTSC